MARGISVLFIIGLILLSSNSQAQDFEKVEVITQHLAGPVHMLQGAGGNVGISAGKDGVLIIDDEFEPLVDKIKAAIEVIQPGPIQFVLNTHWHGDHTGGNKAMAEESVIIAHNNVRTRLAEEQFMTFLNRSVPAAHEAAWPVITFENSISIHFNDEEIKIWHKPSGHTDGDSIVYFTKSNVLHTGDLFFNGMFPFIDLSSGGSVDGYIKNVYHLLATINSDTIIIPGHGPVATYNDLRTFKDMLEQTSQYVHTALKKGLSVEEIQSIGLAATWKDWPWAFISTNQWIQIIAEDYKA
ncbi:MAG: cyclase [Candidatus Omnitrophota bacterium]|jgi:cyclase